MKDFRDETTNLQIEQAAQRALEDLLTYKRYPAEADVFILPPHSELRAIIDDLTITLNESGGTGMKRAYKTILKYYPWISALRSKPVPARPGETVAQEKEVSYAGTLLSDVTAKETDYLWYPRLPRRNS